MLNGGNGMSSSDLAGVRIGLREEGRMAVDDVLCLHCGACVGSCPANSMFLHDNFITFDESCTQCGICVRVCAVGAIDYPRGHRLSQLR